MHDDFQNHTAGLTSPATAGEEITPNDTVDLGHVTRAFYVGQAGDLTARLVSGDTITFLNMQPGAVYAFRVSRVLATGTTASGIVGLR